MAGIFTIVGKVVVLHLARVRKARHEAMLKGSLNLPLQEGTDDNVASSTKPCPHEETTTMIIMIFFVVTQILANGCMFVAPWFGAVSIYWPCYVASQLLANMLIVGAWLHHERFEKPAQIATLVVVVAVLFTTLCGPSDSLRSKPPDIAKLLKGNWMAMAWLGFLGLVFVTSFGSMLFVLFYKRRHARRLPQEASVIAMNPAGALVEAGLPCSQTIFETILLLVSTTCSALSATASKAASTLPVDSPFRPVLLSVTWLIILCWSIENYVEGRYVERLGRFLPSMTLGSIVLNALTGLWVWDDAQTVTSWTGYMAALVLVGMGVYLISDWDVVGAARVAVPEDPPESSLLLDCCCGCRDPSCPLPPNDDPVVGDGGDHDLPDGLDGLDGGSRPPQRTLLSTSSSSSSSSCSEDPELGSRRIGDEVVALAVVVVP